MLTASFFIYLFLLPSIYSWMMLISYSMLLVPNVELTPYYQVLCSNRKVLDSKLSAKSVNNFIVNGI